jgi:hypothetical protein
VAATTITTVARTKRDAVIIIIIVVVVKMIVKKFAVADGVGRRTTTLFMCFGEGRQLFLDVFWLHRHNQAKTKRSKKVLGSSLDGVI